MGLIAVAKHPKELGIGDKLKCLTHPRQDIDFPKGKVLTITEIEPCSEDGMCSFHTSCYGQGAFKEIQGGSWCLRTKWFMIFKLTGKLHKKPRKHTRLEDLIL